MEHFEIKEEKLTYDSIRSLASNKALRARMKPNETFYIPTPQAAEVESILKGEQIGYKTATHPTYNLILFTIQN